MMDTQMNIGYRRTGGSQPVQVSVYADNRDLIIQWNECDLILPLDVIRTVIGEDDGK